MKKELFEQLKQSLREAGQIKRGAMKPSRVFKIDPKNDIVKVRGRLGLSQSRFANILGISADTLQLGARPALSGRSGKGAAENCGQASRIVARSGVNPGSLFISGWFIEPAPGKTAHCWCPVAGR